MEGGQPTNIECGVLLKAEGIAAVAELRARFPIRLAPDAAFGTSREERGFVLARGPTDSDNSIAGLQMRWRVRCNDLSVLPAWRAFLFGFWSICSRCGAAATGPSNLPATAAQSFSAAAIRQIEQRAHSGAPFLCTACQANGSGGGGGGGGGGSGGGGSGGSGSGGGGSVGRHLPELRACDIGVITPYRKQVEVIGRHLEGLGVEVRSPLLTFPW